MVMEFRREVLELRCRFEYNQIKMKLRRQCVKNENRKRFKIERIFRNFNVEEEKEFIKEIEKKLLKRESDQEES